MRCLLLCLFLFVTACATPVYRAPAIDPARADAERSQLIIAAMQTALDRRARVYDLNWPLLTANTDLCPATRPTIGIVFGDRPLWARMAGGLREAELERIGVPEGIRIVHVSKGSPAARSGLAAGMALQAVNGEPMSDLDSMSKRIRQALDDDGTVSLGTDQGDFTVEAVTACDIAVKISTSQAINANAIEGDIVIYTGLVRALDDPALQYVIAHEAAHVILRHPRKYWRNLTVSGAVVAAPFVYGGAMVLDGALSVAGKRPDISMQRRSLRLLAPWAEDFEAEADYVGLYLFARAEGDLTAARQTFDVFSTESPDSIYAPGTHPLTPDRIAALEAAIAEINIKRQRGLSLLPERVDD
ncbi:M48 family metallopeptidase [Parvularcula sp. LCG005]|uniref:M48 family metallopeptidase n=1 Tax=Parvularcula sp. LCG005 TaxID=3078805 RepID=UPI002943A295|nr:M48 family metallopeptidase [Parvularcula sp. LCG005]WOI52857.1 M48 family metallopeptidase [Parvularcula sp. LCG005]